MIALKALKYKIYEYCLEVLITKLTNNLITNISFRRGDRVRVNQLVPGMKISKIIVRLIVDESIFDYQDCIITAVQKYGGSSKDDYVFYQVSFTCHNPNDRNSRDYQSWNTSEDLDGTSDEMEFIF